MHNAARRSASAGWRGAARADWRGRLGEGKPARGTSIVGRACPPPWRPFFLDRPSVGTRLGIRAPLRPPNRIGGLSWKRGEFGHLAAVQSSHCALLFCWRAHEARALERVLGASALAPAPRRPHAVACRASLRAPPRHRGTGAAAGLARRRPLPPTRGAEPDRADEPRT